MNIVWLAQWSWYGGKSSGLCVFGEATEAIKYARYQGRDFVNFDSFPDKNRQFPYDDRDGTEIPELTPVFIARWDRDGGGSVSVTKMSVCPVFDWAAVPPPSRVSPWTPDRRVPKE